MGSKQGTATASDPEFDGLVRRHARRLRSLVRRFRGSVHGNPWRGYEDWESEAWEAAFRVAHRFRASTPTDLDNLVVVAARNALVNLKRKLQLESALELPASPVLAWVPKTGDELAGLETRVWAIEVAAKLRPLVQVVFQLILEAWAAGEEPPPVIAIAERVGVCPDTVRARRDELRRVLKREFRWS